MKMRKLYTLAAIAALPLTALARPAAPWPGKYTNPDGTVVEYRVHGDENFSYITDVDNSLIYEFKGKSLSPVTRNGQQLRATRANLELLRAELPAEPEASATRGGTIHRMADLDMSGRSLYPTTGNVRACVILLEYADTPFSMKDPVDQFNRLCNEKGYSDFNSKGSAKDYYEACSNGIFSPTFDIYGPVKLEHEAKWYVGDDDPTLPGYRHNARFGVAIKEALEALDPTVDFSVYDYDNNNEIDNIFFFFSGYGQADLSTVDPEAAQGVVWPHQADFRRYTNLYPNTIGLDPIFVDGKQMTTYACSNELNASPEIPAAQKPWVDGIGSFCHEYGHVLGLPDLYDTLDTRTSTPGKYTVMDTGSYNSLSTCPPLFSAYERWVCNWIEYTDAADDNEYILNPQTSKEANAVRIRIPRPGTTRFYPEYYILENRANDGWDSTVPSHGMLIWRINYSNDAWVSNQVNVNKNPRVELIGPKNSTLKGWPGVDNEFTSLTPSMALLTPSVLNGRTADVVLSNISYDNDAKGAVKVEYNKYKEHDKSTLLHSRIDADHTNRTLTFSWDALEGATDYKLTVKRTNTSGSQLVVDEMDEKSLGNVLSHTVGNISEVQWKQTFTASVRVVVGIPSTVTSNVLKFIPANLPEGSGVEEIGGEATLIYGGIGEIIAPEGARAFNLNGVETGLTNLPAGVYIVTTPYATAKVVVR